MNIPVFQPPDMPRRSNMLVMTEGGEINLYNTLFESAIYR